MQICKKALTNLLKIMGIYQITWTTVFAIDTRINEEHSLNDDSSIILIDDGITISINDVQPLNIEKPIVVTLFGILIDIKIQHSEKHP